jgi:hypothetical protein
MFRIDGYTRPLFLAINQSSRRRRWCKKIQMITRTDSLAASESKNVERVSFSWCSNVSTSNRRQFGG